MKPITSSFVGPSDKLKMIIFFLDITITERFILFIELVNIFRESATVSLYRLLLDMIVSLLLQHNYCVVKFFCLFIYLFQISAQQGLSHVQPHPPHSATSEQPMVRGNKEGASPQSSHLRVSRNGSEHFRWARGKSHSSSTFIRWTTDDLWAKAGLKADDVSNLWTQHITIGTVAWNWN